MPPFVRTRNLTQIAMSERLAASLARFWSESWIRGDRTTIRPWMLAVASFLVYVGTVFTLPQIADSRLCCEQSSFAAAVSHIIYGTRPGAMYTGVFDLFMGHFGEPMSQVLDEVRAELPLRPPGMYSPTTLDGNGVGYPLTATLAFGLFGLHWWAPALLMLLLMAASTIAFLRRFPPLLATLYFAALTAMLFSPLVSNPMWRWQFPLGGARYFSLAGMLALLHILMTLLGRRARRPGWPLVVQSLVLPVAGLTRGSVIVAFAAIALVGLVRCRRRPGIVREFGIVACTGASVVLAMALIVSPQWFATGRFNTIVWTRIAESLGLNPNLPIAELNEMYPCRQFVPSGIPPGIGDQGGGCIWLAYVAEHRIPSETLWDKSYGGEFDGVLRQAFFQIALRYPWLTLQTFAYYKPKAVIDSIGQSFRFRLSGYPFVAFALLLVAVAIAMLAAATAVERIHEAIAVAIAAASSTAAYIVAYANPATTGDLFLWCLIGIALAGGAIFRFSRQALRGSHETARRA
jgi:hypothetical protein